MVMEPGDIYRYDSKNDSWKLVISITEFARTTITLASEFPSILGRKRTHSNSPGNNSDIKEVFKATPLTKLIVNGY